MVKSELLIPKVWRSEVKNIALFFFFCILSVVLSEQFPGSVMTASIFSIGSTTVYLTLPLWWFVPFVTYVMTLVKIYNVKYTVDNRGIEARIGILSLNQSITRVRYQDIRNIQTKQTILDRALDIGRLEISTAATGTTEIIMNGISVPNEVKEMLERERDSRQKAERAAGKKVYQEGVSA